MRPVRKRLRRALSAVAGAVLLLVLFAHPFFATTRPSGGHVLVAEGWMHREGLRNAARLFREGRYTRLYLTGTVRPFAYYLEPGGALVVELAGEGTEAVSLRIDGLPGARWALLADGDTLLRATVGRWATTHRAGIHAHPVSRLRLAGLPMEGQPPGTAALFVRDLRIDGGNAHALARRIAVERADGRVREGRTNHAEEARDFLLGEGVPDSLMTAVPAMVERRRTLSSAMAFAAVARRDGIGACDVATLGVHARRTWKRYAMARASEADVGIIALPDPSCGRWNWWTTVHGWHMVVKELAALPSTWPATLVGGKTGPPPPRADAGPTRTFCP